MWTGSKKQIEWAKEIKAQKMAFFEGDAFSVSWEEAKPIIQKWIDKGLKRYGSDKGEFFYANACKMAKQNHYAGLMQKAQSVKVIDTFINHLKSIEDAKWWIDRRDFSLDAILSELI